MQLIYKALANKGQLYIIKGFLQHHGIECTVKNEDLDSLTGKLSFIDACVELWVEDKDYEKAKEIINNNEKD
jgi:Putative prokaryotic signal transducing protein